ncbi:hypothetical protein ACFLZI_04205 [Nitrospirota bacterium]
MKLEHVAFLGRTYAEYIDMFNLDEVLLGEGTILDCPAGPSSFAAEAHAKGHKVIASDILFEEDISALKSRFQKDFARIFDTFDEVEHRFTWDYYGDKERVIALRRKAMETFLADFPKGKQEGRYIEQGLPKLPFADGEFRLVLSGHFLFLYEQWISLETHMEYIRELLRVSSGEVRIFPLMTLEGSEYDYLSYVLNTFRDEGVAAEIDPVKLEFMRGGNQMLRLMKEK